MKNILIFVFLIFGSGLFCAPQDKMNAEVFDAAINEVAKFHYDGKFRQKYAEKINYFRQKSLKSVNFTELGRVLNEFFRQLDDSHLGVAVPSEKAEKIFVPLKNDARLLESDGKVLVCETSRSSVFKCGDELLSVNGCKADVNARTGAAFQLNHKLSFGTPGTEMQAVIIRDGKKMTVRYIAERLQRMPDIFKFGVMPAMPEEYTSKLIDERTGYIRFGLFSPNIVQKFKKDINTIFLKVPKLIIDLRSNSGGLILMGVHMASFLSGKRVDFGKMIIDGQPLNPKSYPQKKRWRGKVFILVGRNSYSTAEIFALAMQQSASAVVIGEKTSGMCLPSVFVPLPHGFKLQTVAGDYISAGGFRPEGRGMMPQIVIKNSAESLKNNRDMPIEYIRNL